MKTQIILWLTVPLFAAGCSTPRAEFYWYQPDKTLEEVKAAHAECKCKAQEDAAKMVEDRYFDRLRSPLDVTDSDPPPSRRSKSADPSLEARAHWGEIYKQNAFNGCMQSRGYVKLRAHQVPPHIKTKELPLGAIAGR
jgi:hypothetical protein